MVGNTLYFVVELFLGAVAVAFGWRMGGNLATTVENKSWKKSSRKRR